EEGSEVAVEQARAKKEKPKQAQPKQSNGKPTSRSGRPIREVKPPSWNRSIKRAALFVPFLLIFLSFGKHPPALPIRIGISLAYSAFFVPIFVFVDRLSVCTYLVRFCSATVLGE